MGEVANSLFGVANLLQRGTEQERADKRYTAGLGLQKARMEGEQQNILGQNAVNLARVKRDAFLKEVVTGRQAILDSNWSEDQIKAILESTPREILDLPFPRGVWAEGFNKANAAHKQLQQQKMQDERMYRVAMAKAGTPATGMGDLVRFETVTGTAATGRGTPEYQQKFLDWQTTLGKAKSPSIVFTEDALRAAAERYAQTGKLPPMGMGRAGAEARAQIINKWADDIKQAGSSVSDQIVKQRALEASTSELKKLQSQRGVVLSFAKTADKNLDIAEELSGKVGRTGVPVLNRWVLAGKRSITGDPDVVAFDAAMRTAINEFAKVTSSATGGGVTSDQARKEVESLLSTANTPEQVKSVIATLRKEMENRQSAYDEQIVLIKEAIGGGKPTQNTEHKAIPSKDEWLKKAKEVNPTASYRELEQYYINKYGKH